MSTTTTKGKFSATKPAVALTEQDVRDYWMGKRIRYTVACFERDAGSWENDECKPVDSVELDLIESVFEVTEVHNIGTHADDVGVADVHPVEDVLLHVEYADGPFTGRGSYIAYGWEAVIVP